jgi:multimeric flavodoxin WrbA
MPRSKIVIFGSSRSDGQMRRATNEALAHVAHEFVDLSKLSISPYDYDHKNQHDDFLPLMERVITFDDIILASPVYWYSMSAVMKTFVDRLSDTLYFRRDLGHQLVGKNVYVLSSYGTDFPRGHISFEIPIKMTCQYMNMNYGGCFYFYDGAKPEERAQVVQDFHNALISPLAPLNKIGEGNLKLRLADLSDRRKLYEWMYGSDSSKSMIGEPMFPEKPTKTWKEFANSWQLFYFQRPLSSLGHALVIEHDGEDVGGIAYHQPDEKNRSEIDIWLRSEKDCNRGIGPRAIKLLCRHLYMNLGILFFWAMPSARNPRSIRALEKIGFKRLPLSANEGKAEFGSQDYGDCVYMIKDMSIDS